MNGKFCGMETFSSTFLSIFFFRLERTNKQTVIRLFEYKLKKYLIVYRYERINRSSHIITSAPFWRGSNYFHTRNESLMRNFHFVLRHLSRINESTDKINDAALFRIFIAGEPNFLDLSDEGDFFHCRSLSWHNEFLNLLQYIIVVYTDSI